MTRRKSSRRLSGLSLKRVLIRSLDVELEFAEARLRQNMQLRKQLERENRVKTVCNVIEPWSGKR